MLRAVEASMSKELPEHENQSATARLLLMLLADDLRQQASSEDLSNGRHEVHDRLVTILAQISRMTPKSPRGCTQSKALESSSARLFRSSTGVSAVEHARSVGLHHGKKCSFDEFCSSLSAHTSLTRDELRTVFNFVNYKGDDKISMKEFAVALISAAPRVGGDLRSKMHNLATKSIRKSQVDADSHTELGLANLELLRGAEQTQMSQPTTSWITSQIITL